MRFLTPGEISEWIKANDLIEDPYTGESEPRFHAQCYAPDTYFAVEYFLRTVFGQLLAEGELLIHVSDWEPSEPCRDFATNALREKLGETRPIDETPGLLINRSSDEVAIALFAQCACFKWKSFVYSTCDRATLYNWEGDIFDFWTDSEAKLSEFRSLMQNFQLAEVEDSPDDEPE
jgi:hypothetical protein